MKTRTMGGVLLGVAAAFSGILWWTISTLGAQSSTLGCVANTPACNAVTTNMVASHVGVGFLAALASMGVYFVVFHQDKAEVLLEERKQQKNREEQIDLLVKVLTPGEKAVLYALAKEENLLQTTLQYRTNLTPGRISQVLSAFEEQGLVKRTPAGRTYRVTLQL